MQSKKIVGSFIELTGWNVVRFNFPMGVTFGLCPWMPFTAVPYMDYMLYEDGLSWHVRLMWFMFGVRHTSGHLRTLESKLLDDADERDAQIESESGSEF